MNGEIKTYQRNQIQKTNSAEVNQQRYWQLLQSKKGEIRKSKRLFEIELQNSIKDSKNFFKHFTNNKKIKKAI